MATDAGTRVSLCGALQRMGFVTRAASDVSGVVTHLGARATDLLMVGLAPGERWRGGCLNELRGHPDGRELPVVVLCEDGDRRSAVAALEDGARDVWVGPLSPLELGARMRSQLRLAAEMQRLRQQVCIDELTGIFNRRGILGMLERETNRLSHNGTALGILLIDLDDFKHINDTYGHSAGDDVLRAIGEVLVNSTRRSDAAGRLGGDEFLVVLPGVDEEQAHQVADRIRSGIGDIRIPGARVRVSASIGVAVSEQRDCPTGHGLIEHADRSMYRRKRANTLPRVVMA
ncbi:GGDEF domain-containing response regulator [Haliangium sp.]|uniref:GGDEF domain-containing response regulator n=1 Tax=Haliangium sp. TaxID=2663208 RepID=UPI003D14B024